MNLKPENPNMAVLNKPNAQQLSAPTMDRALKPSQAKPDTDNILAFPVIPDLQTSNELLDQRLFPCSVAKIHPSDPTGDHQSLGEESTTTLQRAKAAGRDSALLVFRLSEHHRVVETFS